MSEATSQNERGSSSPWDLICPQKQARVLVDGVSIPVTSVTTEMRDEGASNIGRLTEVRFPYRWSDISVVDYINSFGDDQQGYDTALVQFKDAGGNWIDVHTGFVRGVSGTNKTGVGRMIVAGPEALVTAVPYSERYDGPTVRQVFEDVASELESKTPFSISVTGVSDRTLSQDAAPFSAFTKPVFNFLDKEMPQEKAFKQFQKNRHTANNVLNWVVKLNGGKWYFVPTGSSSVALAYDDGGGSAHFEDEELGGGLTVLENDAMAEIVPPTEVTVSGTTAASIAGFQVKHLPSDKFPEATASYPPLERRAGGEYPARTIPKDLASLKAVEGEAVEQLEEHIVESGLGDIELRGEPSIQPYDTLRAYPECHDIYDFPPLEYTVTRVEHSVSSEDINDSSTDSAFTTGLTVAPYFDRDKVEVESRMREA